MINYFGIIIFYKLELNVKHFNNFMMKIKLISKLGEDFEVPNSSKN